MSESKEWNDGYTYGMAMNLNLIPSPPECSKSELADWYKGLDAAISDRLS